jgi:hypothetical protein
MNRLFLRVVALLLGVCVLPAFAADPDERKASLEALKAMNDYVGEWNGTGGPPRAKPGSKDFWNETVSWGWKFKGDDVSLQMQVKDGKHIKAGEMRYLPEKKKYELTVEDAKGKKQVYEGEIKDEVMTLERVDADTKDTHRLTMNLAGDGVRLIYRAARKPSGRTLYTPEYEVALNKAGESLGAKEKKNVCIVTGGLGTMPVSFKGQQFWVCCSGCRDAFNENPEKFIKEFEEAKKKKKG